MKLYKVYINNGLDYEDDEIHYTELFVEESLEKAVIRAENMKLEYFGIRRIKEAYVEVSEVNEVDGYGINISNKTL